MLDYHRRRRHQQRISFFVDLVSTSDRLHPIPPPLLTEPLCLFGYVQQKMDLCRVKKLGLQIPFNILLCFPIFTRV